jgi:pyruvate carboxylase subunit B
MKDYFMPPESKCVEPTIPWSPMPGGALTANTQMMRDNNILDRYYEVATAMGEVVRLGGFGTSVTPVSQFYFQQAFNNVMFGPWKKIAEGYGKMVLGYFGKTPIAPDPEIIKIASNQLKLEPTTRCPMDINDEDPKKGIAAARKLLQITGLAETDENIFIAATCKDKGIAFLNGAGTVSVRKNAKKEKPLCEDSTKGYTVTLGGKPYTVVLSNNQATINGISYNFEIANGNKVDTTNSTSEVSSKQQKTVKAPVPGTIVKLPLKINDSVQINDTVVVIESMKMEIEVKSTVAGIISDITVKTGDKVTADQVIVYIS